MKRLVALFLCSFLAFACSNASNSADNSDFEGVWAANGVSLRFYSATVVWNEAGFSEKIYTFSAGSGKITFTSRSGSKKEGAYTFSSSDSVLTIAFSDRTLELVKMSED